LESTPLCCRGRKQEDRWLCSSQNVTQYIPILTSESDEEAEEVAGHITSLSVLRTHRKLGLAYKLMEAARNESYN